MSEAMSSCHPPAACRPAPARATLPLIWPGRAWFARARGWFAEGRRRRAAIRELQRVSDGQLRDIGIARDAIEEVVDTLMARGRARRHQSLRGSGEP
jgi:uncharacterized protein YjiS (DUF1127 family)